MGRKALEVCMQTFKIRVNEELNELNLKINSLNMFVISRVFKTLDRQDQILLERQLDVMGAYRHILEQRIERF
jgi:hypothetical protein